MSHDVRGGWAFPAMLVALLAATALGHVTLYVARQELAVARAERSLLTARLTAEGAVRHVMPSIGPGLAVVAVGDSVVSTGSVGARATYRAVGHRVARETYLIAADGWSDGSAWRVGRLFRALDPGARIDAFSAALEAGRGARTSGAARVEGLQVARPPFVWSSTECGRFQPLADSIFPTGTVPGAAIWTSPLQGADPARTARLTVPADPPPALSLGSVDFDALRSVADVVLGSPGGPTTSVDMGHACPAGPRGGWGTPTDPGGRCGGSFSLVVGQGPVTVTGGEGQGILVVDGDLRFLGSSTFAGVVLVSGTLELFDDATLVGWARAAGTASLADRARLSASACAGLRALDRADLRTPRVVEAGSWLWPL